MAGQQAINKQQVALVFLALAAVCLASGAQAAIFDPLVSTGVSELSPEGRHVAVHVPAFFNMKLDTRGPNKGFRLDETVMGGLVNIHLDRVPGADGNLTGPIQVRVGGITMYDNGQSSPVSS